MVAIVDYGVGNLFSLKSSLAYIGEEAVVTSEPKTLERAERIILPGVGAFADAAEKLSGCGLDKTVKALAEAGKPLMGICLGMQLLFDKSFEFGDTEGLGLVRGEVKPIEPVIPKDYKVPHIGWNALRFSERGRADGIFKYIKDGDCVYFVHSFAATGCGESLLASTEYGAELTAAVRSGSVFGMQFHPEKSGDVGLKILKAFCEI